jgi:hypothetical protein
LVGVVADRIGKGVGGQGHWPTAWLWREFSVLNQCLKRRVSSLSFFGGEGVGKGEGGCKDLPVGYQSLLYFDSNPCNHPREIKLHWLAGGRGEYPARVTGQRCRY